MSGIEAGASGPAANSSGAGGSGSQPPVTPPPLLTMHSAPAGDTTVAAAALAAASAARAARTPARARRSVPDAPRDPADEPAAKRRKVRNKRGARERRQRALRNMPSDMWAAIFKQLPELQRELPKLRLVCRQFDDAVSGRVVHHIRPAKDIRDVQLSSLLQRFPILQSIDASGCPRLTGAWLRDLEHHVCLRRLVLDKCDRIFAPRESNYWIYISSAELLQHLSVADNAHFSDEDLALAYELENLRSLNISGCSRVTSDALMMFGQDPGFARHLTSLDLSRLPKLADSCMAGLPGLSHLQRLSLAHCTALTWEGLGHMAPLPELTSLTIEGCEAMSLAGAALGVSQLVSLQQLDASWLGTEFPEEEEAKIDRALRAARDGHGWPGWAECVAGTLTNLQELRVAGANMTDFHLMALRPLTGLTALDISDSQEVTSDGLSALLQLKSLQAFNLEGCLSVGDEGMTTLAQLPALMELDLGACDEVTDQGLEALASASQLRCLNAVDCTVSDEGVAELQKHIPQLAVSHTRTPEGYWEIVISDSDAEDLEGDEWEVMLMEAGENSDNASSDDEAQAVVNNGGGEAGNDAAANNAAGGAAAAEEAAAAAGNADGAAGNAADGQP